MALILNGTNQYARASLIATRSSGSPWAFFCYVKFDNVASAADQQIFNAVRSSSNSEIGLRMMTAADTMSARYTPSAVTNIAEDTGLTLVNGTWYRCYMEYSAGTLGLVIENRAKVTTTVTPEDYFFGRIGIGHSLNNGGYAEPYRFLGGAVAHAAQWNSILTSQQITDLCTGVALPDGIGTAPDHYKPLVLDETGGTGADYTLFGSPTFDSEDPASTGVTLVIQDASHAQTADNLALIQANTLVMQDSAHAQTSDNLDLDVGGTLAIQDADHAHTADNVTLIQANTLVIQDSLHGHSSDNVDLVQANVLAIGDAIHTHTVDNVVLVAGITLTVQDATHTQSADNVVLTQANILAIQEAIHAHTSENLDLTQANVLIVSDALHNHIADNIALSIPLGFDIVTPDSRVFVIPGQDRNFVIVKQDRSFVIQ